MILIGNLLDNNDGFINDTWRQITRWWAR